MKNMKRTKLSIGIISVLLSIVVTIQSMLADMVGSLIPSSSSGKSYGMTLAIGFLVAGSIGIIQKESTKSGLIAGLIFIVGGIIGIIGSVNTLYSDLLIWSCVSIIFGLVFIIGDFKPIKQMIKQIIQKLKK